MNAKRMAGILVALVFVNSLAPGSTMELSCRVRGHVIEVSDAFFSSFRERVLPADQCLLAKHDELVVALKQVASATDAPDWIKAEGHYTLTFDDSSRVFCLDFAAETGAEKITEFNRRLGPVYSRVRIDADIAVMETFMKEVEALRKQVDEEKSPLRRKLLEAILAEKARILREMPM